MIMLFRKLLQNKALCQHTWGRLRKISVEFHPSADHKSEAMLQVSPAGTLPILKTDEMVLSETQAMLFWMAKKFDRSGMWWPKDDNPVAQAFVLQWLGFSGI